MIVSASGNRTRQEFRRRNKRQFSSSTVTHVLRRGVMSTSGAPCEVLTTPITAILQRPDGCEKRISHTFAFGLEIGIAPPFRILLARRCRRLVRRGQSAALSQAGRRSMLQVQRPASKAQTGSLFCVSIQLELGLKLDFLQGPWIWTNREL